MEQLVQLVRPVQGVREAETGQMDHLECEVLTVQLGRPGSLEPLERMVHQDSQEVQAIREILEHLGKRGVLAWMVLEEMQASPE